MPDHARADSEFPADPYPGAVPPFSFVHLDGRSRPLTFLDGDPRVEGVGLDAWLAGLGAPPLAGRVPLLAYGSNRNPSKITWLRRALGLTGPVVVLRVRTEGIAAVWASGVRARDGQRTSVLGAAPGVSERHAVWLATPGQIAVLDHCEGRGDRHRLARLGTGAVHLDESDEGAEDDGRGRGLRIEAPWCYLGLSATRQPLLVDGRPVRCADVGQRDALALRGDPAPDDGLDAATVTGAPHPDEWPAAVFVYGTLQPGEPAWPLLADHATGRPRRATATGRVYDTGRGYPALLPGGAARAPGWVVDVRDPVAALRHLDRYEGDEYRRVRAGVVLDGAAAPDGGDRVTAWTYAWASGDRGLTALPTGWPG